MFIKSDKGASEALGFVAVLMLIMLVIFNITPLFLMLKDYFLLSQVQRDALLQMELSGGMTAVIEDKITDKLADYGFDTSKVDIDATSAPVDYGLDLEIELEYSYILSSYDFSGLSFFKTDNPQTMISSAKSVSFYFEK